MYLKTNLDLWCVALNEVNFSTMESKLCPGLHIVGELLNIDGVTGGLTFNRHGPLGFGR